MRAAGRGPARDNQSRAFRAKPGDATIYIQSTAHFRRAIHAAFAVCCSDHFFSACGILISIHLQSGMRGRLSSNNNNVSQCSWIPLLSVSVQWCRLESPFFYHSSLLNQCDTTSIFLFSILQQWYDVPLPFFFSQPASCIGSSECGRNQLQFDWPTILSKLRTNNIM